QWPATVARRNGVVLDVGCWVLDVGCSYPLRVLHPADERESSNHAPLRGRLAVVGWLRRRAAAGRGIVVLVSPGCVAAEVVGARVVAVVAGARRDDDGFDAQRA